MRAKKTIFFLVCNAENTFSSTLLNTSTSEVVGMPFAPTSLQVMDSFKCHGKAPRSSKERNAEFTTTTAGSLPREVLINV